MEDIRHTDGGDQPHGLWDDGSWDDGAWDDEPWPNPALRRRKVLRVIALLVVVAMVLAFVIPAIVRTRRSPPPEPPGVLTLAPAVDHESDAPDMFPNPV